MQSFLQHRQFRKQVEQQQERYQRKCKGTIADQLQSDQIPSLHTPRRAEDQTTQTEIPDYSSSELNEKDIEAVPNANVRLNNNDHEEDEVSGGTLGERDPERLQVMRTISCGMRLGQALTGVSVRTRTNEVEHVFVVGYEGLNDPLNPQNWTFMKKLVVTFQIAAIGFIVGWSSAITSAAIPQASKEFHVGEVVESLATGLFLIGFGVGALVSGPISEAIGRNPVYLSTMTLFMIFVMASGLAPNIVAQLIFRTIAGIFAATPLVCAGGTLADVWSPLEQTFAFPLFANGGFSGPMLAPVVGGYIAQSSLLSWRWVEWITLIIAGLILVMVLLFQPETYSPILLSWKAKEIRRITGDHRFRSEIEVRDRTLVQMLKTALYRPFLITFSEPIIILISVYLTVVYIIMFTFLNGFAFVFSDTHGFSQGKTGLCFLGIVVGLCISSLWIPFVYGRTKRKTEVVRIEMDKQGKKGPVKLAPEERLLYAMIGAPALPISLFWMAWTSYSSISPWSAIAASVLSGYGILCIFISCYQYIIDVYTVYAASALAAVTLIRYLAAGGMIVVSIPMYRNLGVHWALTILGGLSAILVPVPYAFWIWGSKIRAMSKFSASKK